MVEKETEEPQVKTEAPETTPDPQPSESPAKEPLAKVVGKPHFAHAPAEETKTAPRKRSRKKSRKPSAKAKPPAAVPADGTLLRKDGDPVVYVMNEGQRRPFADLDAFHMCCGGGANITVLAPKEIDPIPEGSEVRGPADLQ
jgi:hypothetical protein